MNEAKLGETLIKLGAINALHLAKAAQQQKKDGGSLSAALIATNAITAEELSRIAATMLKLPWVSLRTVSVPPDMVKLLTPEVANKAKAIVLKAEGKNFFVAMSQPTNIDTIDLLRFRLSGNVNPVVVPDAEMERALEFYYGKLKNTPLSLPPSTGVNFVPEQFDVRKARAAAQPAAQPAAAPRPAPAPQAPAQAAPAAVAPVAKAALAAPVQAAPAAPVAPVAPEAVDEVLELVAEAPEPPPAAEAPAAAAPSDDDLIKELANFLLGGK